MDQLGKIPVIRKLKRKFSEFLENTIEEQCLNFFQYGSKVEELRKSSANLRRKRDMMKHLVVDDFRNGKETAPYVSDWSDKVDNIIPEIDKFWQDKRLPYTMCSRGYLPKPGMRFRLARKAYKLVRQVNKLSKTSFSDGISSGLRSLSIDFLLSAVNFESFDSRKQVLEEINKALKDTTIKMVGVYGTGGVGKTTLVKEVASEAQRVKLFDVVIFATVTANPDITQIQGQLADQLGARLNEETEIGRASRLKDIFKKEKKNTLVILDDLWAELDLNKLGIPVDDVSLSPNSAKDTPKNQMSKEEETIGSSKMLKVLLTSRTKVEVFDKMHVKENFCLKVLEDQEAEVLFKKMVGMDGKPPEFEPLAAKISKKCGGLPIAIVTIGRTLRSKGYSEWKDTLGQIERQEFTEVIEPVEFSTKLSFKYLENEELKSTFLLFAQLGYHPRIMDLVKYCIGVGIFEGFPTIKEAREKVLKSIKKLKNSGLLLDYDGDRFKMHDMIREIALSIASKERDFFTMENGKLKEWPHENKLEKYNGISICNSDIIDKLPNSVRCPRLELFHVDCLNSSFIIPDGFFRQAGKLRTLILTGIDVSNFCASIGCSINLRMLCLERCKLGAISFIGNLEKLRILSLSGSSIEILPTELGKLHKLQLLDISNCSELREIPPNVLSSLNSLEELYMRNSVKWESQKNQSENNILAELRHLNELKSLDVCLPSVAVLPRNLFFNKLDSYKIVIGDAKMLSMGNFKMPEKDEASRVLVLQIKEGNVIRYQEGLRMLFRGVEKMLLGQLDGVESIFSELNLEGFPCLKELCIVDNSAIEYIIDANGLLNLNYVFLNLESLCLYKLDRMVKISNSSNLSGTSFCSLKVVRIRECDKLESVFSVSIVLLLTNLEKIDISQCTSMKTIVPKEEQDAKIIFPNLRSLALHDLRNFIGVYSNDQGQNGDFILFNEQVEILDLETLELSSINIKEIGRQLKLFENLTKLNVQNCYKMQYLLSFPMAKSMKKLKYLSLSAPEMLGIFKYENVDKNEAKEVPLFPKLEEIHLELMDNLTSIWPSEANLGSFPNLNSMSIGWCEQLVTVIPSHMVGVVGRLESLSIISCGSVEQIFDLCGAEKPNVGNQSHLQVLQIDCLKNLKHIWKGDPEGILDFKRLHSIKVTACDELEYLFPISVAKYLQKLGSLSVFDCPQMKEIARGDKESNENFEFPQVSVVEMERLPQLQYFYMGSHSIKWPKLKKLSMIGCDQLEAFKTNIQISKGGPIFLLEEIIPNLETMEMNLKEVGNLDHCIKNYCMNHLKIFHVESCPSTEILYQLLYRMPYLERLTLFECDLRELIPVQENICTFLQLKYLKLDNLNALKNIGFERGPALQYCLVHLYIWNCEELIILGPSSVTLTHLTTLEVWNCQRMKSLMGFSIAKSLVQLVSLEVNGCEGMEGIVARQNDEVNMTHELEIVFSKLKTLELVDLPNLTCFCNFEIRNSFEFPSLEKLVVKECSSMRKVCNGVCTAPKLQVIEINLKEENWSWKGDLNIRMRKEFIICSLPYLTYLSLFEESELAYSIWHEKVPLPDYSFGFLETLVVENCEFLSIVIPSHILLYFTRLEKLEVRRCSLVVSIFEVNDEENVRFYLRSMTLDHLPNMKNVWSKNPEGILSFESLEEVEVTDCDSLQILFPTDSITKNLTKLTIKNCAVFKEFVEEVEFPRLESLSLGMLPKLRSGSTKLLCPSLTCLNVYHCGDFTKSQILVSESKSFQGEIYEDHSCNSNDSQSFSSQQEVSSLKALSLTKEEAIMICNGGIPAVVLSKLICNGDIPVDVLSKLTGLQLHCFHKFTEEDTLPFDILSVLTNVNSLSVACSDFREIFPYTLDPGNGNQFKLTKLRLEFLPQLNSIGIEQPSMNALQKELTCLEVERCPRLAKLVHSPVSFSNLEEIYITKCHGLEYLFTTSTASNLPNLWELTVLDCESIKEVVAQAENEMKSDVEITFQSAEKMKLKHLPRLACFYAGTSTLNFPMMWQMEITQCPNINLFCQGHITAPKMQVNNIPPCVRGDYWQCDRWTHLL